MSHEIDLYNFLSEQVAAIADENNPLFGLTVHDTSYREIKTDKGVQVANCLNARVAPLPGVDGVKQVDVVLVLIVWARVARDKKQDRASARDAAITLAEEVALLLFQHPTLPDANGTDRVEFCRPLDLPRAFDNTDATPYAVSNLTVVINETGEINFDGRR